MRKKPVIILGVALVLASAIVLWYKFGILEPYNRWTAKRDIEAGLIQIVQVGYPAPGFAQRELRAKSFGYEIDLYGCVVSTTALNGISDYNKVMREYIERKNGADFWKKADDNKPEDADTATTDLRLDQIYELVESQPQVKERAHYVDSASGGTRHLALMADMTDSSLNTYRVRVAEDNGVTYFVHFNFTVDANTMTILPDPPEDSIP